MATLARDWYLYTTDAGDQYNVLLSHRYAQNPDLGWLPGDRLKPTLPRGWRPRWVELYSPGEGWRRARAPVGSISASAWATPAAVTIPVLRQDGTWGNYFVHLRVGEKHLYRGG
jgi:hypothetical protein